jgi:hypothetical protein
VPATTAPENNDKEITPSTDSRIVGNRGGTCIDYSAFIVAEDRQQKGRYPEGGTGHVQIIKSINQSI